MGVDGDVVRGFLAVTVACEASRGHTQPVADSFETTIDFETKSNFEMSSGRQPMSSVSWKLQRSMQKVEKKKQKAENKNKSLNYWLLMDRVDCELLHSTRLGT